MSDLNGLMDTYSIPDDVDPAIAVERNRLIEDWRAGELEDEIVLSGIAKLYWNNQDTATDETRFWLCDTLPEFAIEAGIDSRRASEIWHSVEE